MLGTNRFNAQAINGLSGKGRQVVVDSITQLDTGAASGAYDVQLSDSVIIIYGSTAMGSPTVDLPAVAEAQGMMLSIWAIIANTTNIVVRDRDDSAPWTDLTFTATADYALLYCDGRTWHVLKEVTT